VALVEVFPKAGRNQRPIDPWGSTGRLTCT